MKLIVLSQESCTPCKFVKNFLQDQNVDFETVDVQNTPKIASQFSIMSTPVTILLDNEGNEIQRVTGFNPIELTEIINKLNS